MAVLAIRYGLNEALHSQRPTIFVGSLRGDHPVPIRKSQRSHRFSQHRRIDIIVLAGFAGLANFNCGIGQKVIIHARSHNHTSETNEFVLVVVVNVNVNVFCSFWPDPVVGEKRKKTQIF